MTVELREDAAGGQLSAAGRRHAIAGALPLLSNYFARGKYNSTDFGEILSRADGTESPDAELAGLRLRIALTAARQLTAVMARLRSTSTFRYEIVRGEQTGAITGVLDINRWATRTQQGVAEPAYPVLETRRGVRTPENALAAFAVTSMIEELKGALASTTARDSSVDYQSGRAVLERLEKDQQLPPVNAAQTMLRRVRTVAAVRKLVSTVRRRIARREITGATAYNQLVTWVEQHLSAGALSADSGDVGLAVYDNTFDRKLFELWCMRALADSLAAAFNVPAPTARAAWRADGVIYEFQTFAGAVKVYFQRSVTTVDPNRSARWFAGSGVALGGIPDITVVVQPRGRETSDLILVDPKLRQRDKSPTEELYKILGYFHNYAVEPARGAILTYTTSADEVDGGTYRDDAAGTLTWVPLNPAWGAEQLRAALEPLVEIILDTLTYTRLPDQVTEALDGLTGDEREVVLARERFREWARGQVADVVPSQQRVASLLTDSRWSALNLDAQAMVATADTVGHQLPAGADFSGPVIGIAASIEYVIHERLITPAFAGTSHGNSVRTFGQCVHAIKDACNNIGGNVGASIRAAIAAAGYDVSTIAAMVDPWVALNQGFRIPAAHRSVLTQNDWQAAYRLVLGEGALLARTLDALTAP